MKDIIKSVAQQSNEKQCGTLKLPENTAIQRYYRQIGIPAVAAAARYQGDAKNPADARIAAHERI